jgi:hypothetical protein
MRERYIRIHSCTYRAGNPDQTPLVSTEYEYPVYSISDMASQYKTVVARYAAWGYRPTKWSFDYDGREYTSA